MTGIYSAITIRVPIETRIGEPCRYRVAPLALVLHPWNLTERCAAFSVRCHVAIGVRPSASTIATCV